MKMMRNSILCLVVLFLMTPLLSAQDLSRYRKFSFGMSLATVLKFTGQQPREVNLIHEHPALIQELTWWPPNTPGVSFQSDVVRQILFSFHNGELYKISVTYDRTSTEGLTTADMIKAITAKYGAVTSSAPDTAAAIGQQYDLQAQPLASWEDSRYSLNLVRSYFSDGFGLVIYSKAVNAEADLAIAEGVKLEKQEGPKKEAERQKKQTDDLEVARQKHQKTFRP
jgi:hypothetical protein